MILAPMARHPRAVTSLGMIALLLVGAILRFSGLNWDAGQHLHPDERFLTIVADKIRFPDRALDYFNTDRSPLNPYNQGFDGFAYGTAPLFVVRAVGEVLGMATYEQINLVGRGLSGIADLGTVGLTFWLGTLVYGRRVGLVAAALLAVTTLHVQLSHFFTVDTFRAFATTLALCAAYRAWVRRELWAFALLGFALGLALAIKLSGALLLPIVALVVLVPPPTGRSSDGPVRRGGQLALCGLVALIVYRTGDPYSFAGPGIFDLVPNGPRFEDLARWVRISSGEIDMPFMIQWAGTPNPWFVLRGILEWGLGPPAGITAFAGLAHAAWHLRRWPACGAPLLLVAWTLLNLGYFGFQFAKFLRYLLPVYPGLVVFAAAVLVRLTVRPIQSPAIARLAPAVLPAVLGATTLYASMFASIYARPHTRVQASEWLYANVAPGSTLAVEHWDDALPLRLPGYERSFREVTLELYAEESPAKARKLAEDLRRADYVVLSSERLLGSIPRLPTRFPVAVEYYRLLLSGELGFEPVAQFTASPGILWMTLDDRAAQEDFTVYDHPTVRVFKKGEQFSPERVAGLFAAIPLAGVEQVKPVDAQPRRGLALDPTETVRMRAGGTWSDSFTLDGWAARLPIVAWLLTLEALALAAAALCWSLFPQLPDRGFAAAKALGLVFVSYVAWLGASVQLVRFGLGSAVCGLLLLAMTSLLVGFRHRSTLVHDLRRRWRWLLLSEVVFLGAFGFMLVVRGANPDLWHPQFGGEKPMDFAYLNAVIKSSSFPPYDPWFAGGYINYYYYGFVLVAVVTHLSSVPPALAYNLAVATVFALSATLAFSIGSALTAGSRASAKRLSPAAITGGTISATCLVLAGNLDGALQLRDALWRLGGEGASSALPAVTGLSRTGAGIVALLRGGGLPGFDFWRSTRLIGPEEPGPIHEFPYFTFLYGDLHAHMISMPLQLCVLLVGIQLVYAGWGTRARGIVSPRNVWTRSALLPTRRTVALLGVAALLIGSLRVTNTWDFPAYLLIAAFAGFLAVRSDSKAGRPATFLWGPAICAALYLVSSLLFWPYLQRYELFYSGMTRVQATTDLSQFLVINGLLAFVTLSWLINQATRTRPSPPHLRAEARATSFLGVLAPPIPLTEEWHRIAAGVVAVGAFAFLAAGGHAVVALALASAAACAMVAIYRPRAILRWWALALGGAAITLLATPELAAVRGDVGRMNTVFKFYLQAWLLLAVLAGPAAVQLTMGRAGLHQASPWRLVWGAAFMTLLAAALVYPIAATPVRLGLRFAPMPWSLDGMAYMAEASHAEEGSNLDLPADHRAIRWMLQNVQGSPPIMEGQTPLYRWGSRFSVYTGLPTIIGWGWHQQQQRSAYRSRVEERERDVKNAYTSPDPESAWSVIRKYGVEYVVVGGVERAYYPAAGLAKFEQMVCRGLQVAYRDGGVIIYRVLSA